MSQNLFIPLIETQSTTATMVTETTTTTHAKPAVAADNAPSPATTSKTVLATGINGNVEGLEAKIRTGSDKNILKHLIAVRSAVIMPPNVPLTDDLERKIPSDAVRSYIADAAEITTFQIFGDELIFLRGETYKLPGKNLYIYCRQAKFAGEGNEVIFDLGANPIISNTDNNTQADETAKPAVFPNQGQPAWNDKAQALWRYAATGNQGSAGATGAKGGTGGIFGFRGSIVLDSAHHLKLSVFAKGSPGGTGQTGAKGGVGGTGSMGGKNKVDGYNDFIIGFDCLKGGAGGKGGTGGMGGSGGKGGDVDTLCSLFVDDKLVTDHTQQTTLELNSDVPGGENGQPGAGGRGGDPGATGKQVLWSNGNFENKDRPAIEFHSSLYPQYQPGSCEIHLDQIPRAAAGASGDAGPSNPQARADGWHKEYLQRPEDVVNDLTLDAHHLMMVIDRLSFEYFTRYSSQVYDVHAKTAETTSAKTTEKDPQKQEYVDTIAWLDEIIKKVNKVGGSWGADWANAFAVPKMALLSFHAQCLTQSDIFNNPLNAVPNPMAGIPKIEDALKKFREVESAAMSMKTAIESTNRTRSDLYTHVTSLQSASDNIMQKISEEQRESDKLTVQINDAIDLQEKRTAYLLKCTSELEDQIKKNVGCDILTILKTVVELAKAGKEGVSQS